MKTYLIPLIMALGASLLPAKPALIGVMALPLADLAMALIAAYRAKRPITSNGLKRTVAKILMYEAAVVLAYGTEVALTGSWVPCVRIVTCLIGMTELKSCLEHLDELNGSPFFASVLVKLAPNKDNNEPPQNP